MTVHKKKLIDNLYSPKYTIGSTSTQKEE